MRLQNNKTSHSFGKQILEECNKYNVAKSTAADVSAFSGRIIRLNLLPEKVEQDKCATITQIVELITKYWVAILNTENLSLAKIKDYVQQV